MTNTTVARFSGVEFVVCNDDPHYYNDVNGTRRGPFWHDFSTENWEPDTLRALSLMAGAGALTLYDIGAWIGPISLFSAALGLDVVSVEPDPAAFLTLRQNALSSRLSGKINLINGAVCEGSSGRFVKLLSHKIKQFT